MLFRILGVSGSNPPVSFITGDILLVPTLAVLAGVAVYGGWRKVPGVKTFLLLCLVLYASMVIEITLFPMPVSLAEVVAARGDAQRYVAPDLNLQPFKSITTHMRAARETGATTFARNWLGNLLLLMPLGFIAPLVARRIRTLRDALVLCVAVSATIELAQYVGSFLVFRLRWKSVDVDDVIVNVAGGLVGFLLWRLVANSRWAHSGLED